jgi:hypothetical protein
LTSSGIEPVLHLPLQAGEPASSQDLSVLLHTYARWGLHYVILFDRPNSRKAWTPATWAQSDLVERFLDRFLPAARTTVQAGLIPVFPPLEPGGSYWDTAFLRATLQGIERRGQGDLFDRLVLSAQASSGERPLNWGAGGPERWPEARPYATSPGGEDQRGFYIFDWYTTVARAATGCEFPFLLLKAGSHSSGNGSGKGPLLNEEAHAMRNLAIAAAAAGTSQEPVSKSTPGLEGTPEPGSSSTLPPLPSKILSVNYWLLAAEANSPHAARAWYNLDGSPSLAAISLRKWNDQAAEKAGRSAAKSILNENNHPLAHYLLLPAYEWGVTDWHLSLVRPFLKKHRPVLGFSLDEAAYASRVTVIGGPLEYPDSALERLRQAGCLVERIAGSGTNIATQLADK